jgi:protein involved in polysaccharide export with SLBB domain
MRIRPDDGEPEAAAATGNILPAFGRSLFWFAVVMAGLAITGCGSLSGSSPSDAGSASSVSGLGTAFYSTNILHEGDVVDITFQYATNFNTLQRIALDGTLNMNTVGPVKAAGKSVFELQQDLAKIYKSLAKDDVITANLMMNSVPVVYVSGAVLKPGEVTLDRPLTAIEAVMAGGGFDSSRARMSDVSVLRIENGQQHAYHVNLKRVLEGKEKEPFYLKPFDIIYVPTKTFNY